MQRFSLALLFIAISATTTWAKSPPLVVQVKDAHDKELGKITIRPLAKGVELKLDLRGLAPGEHAIHFHNTPACEGPDFKSAGPHFNPEGKQHGMENPLGAHAGDMLNFKVDAKGKARATIVNKSVTLGDDDHSLLANGGTAIVVHANPDDMKSDPAGNAGDRVGCGVIKK